MFYQKYEKRTVEFVREILKIRDASQRGLSKTSS